MIVKVLGGAVTVIVSADEVIVCGGEVTVSGVAHCTSVSFWPVFPSTRADAPADNDGALNFDVFFK